MFSKHLYFSMMSYRFQEILPSGQEIAVKRLAGGSGQGDLEFKNEVLLLTRLQYRNLVKLLCFYNEGDEKILVYEHVPNSSLDHFISVSLGTTNCNVFSLQDFYQTKEK